MTLTSDTLSMRHAPAPRRAAATLSVLLALGLNLAALGAFGAVVAGWRASGAPMGPSNWITAVYVLPSAPPEVPAAPLRLTPPATPPAPVKHEALAKNVAAQPVASAMPAPKRPADTESSNAVRYYRTGEVDRPAQPDSDWNLDPAALDLAGLSTMVFEVFVGSDGAIVDCAILEPKTLSESIRTSLEARLRQTVLQPAQRAGVAVPSVRRIEISVQ